MPPMFSDEDSRLHDSFDIQTASTLYWKSVPVLVRHSDREDVSENITVRILSGVQKQNHSLRVLRVYLSSESDLFFLHTLEVTEEDFQNLKVEQGILVDFANFPGKIISLLEKCIAAQEADSPRFQAVLGIRGGESTFKIVETNDFKQLPHISLSFRPGNDSAVKQFLAFRLLEVKTNCEDLTAQLYQTQDERDQARVSLSGTQESLMALKEKYDKHVMEMEASIKTQQAASQEERIREKALLKEQFEMELEEVERRQQEQLLALNDRINELDTENRKLREQKYQLDTRVSELSHRLGTSEGAKKSLEEESARLRASNKQLSAERHESDIKLNEARARLSAVEEKVAAQTEVVQQQSARIKDLDESLRQWESRCAEQKAAASSAEQRAKEAATEVIKGNQIIEKLTTDVKLGKEKVKRKHAIIVRQEEELSQREAALEKATKGEQTASARCEHLQKELKAAEDAAQEMRSKLDDARQQLQSNEQMIRWLNQQVTDAQLQATTSIPGSRYASFKPSITLSNPNLQTTNLLPSSSYTSRYTGNPTSTSRPITPAAMSPRHLTHPRYNDTTPADTTAFTDSYTKAARFTSLSRPYSAGGTLGAMSTAAAAGATPASVYS